MATVKGVIKAKIKKVGKDSLVCLLVLASITVDEGFCQQAALLKNANAGLRQRKLGDPLAHLPSNMEVLTSFGERADISPDNTKVAFMAKTFGDAMIVDLKTRKLSCLTCNIPAAAFLRVMHLATGDYLLIGPDHFESVAESKLNADVWFLSKVHGSLPVKIGLKVSEGVALSKNSLKIAYTEKVFDNAGPVTRLMVADIDLRGDTVALVNKTPVIDNRDAACTVEAQDFYDGDSKLIFFCYVPNGAFDVQGVDLKTLRVTNFSNAPGAFNEPEGIFPGGRHTTVEMDRQCEWLGGRRGSSNLDIWKMELDGSGKNLERLTHFNDYEGGKAANPVVSTDGRFMAFQVAKSTDPPGMGHGLMVLWFHAKPAPE